MPSYSQLRQKIDHLTEEGRYTAMRCELAARAVDRHPARTPARRNEAEGASEAAREAALELYRASGEEGAEAAEDLPDDAYVYGEAGLRPDDDVEWAGREVGAEPIMKQEPGQAYTHHFRGVSGAFSLQRRTNFNVHENGMPMSPPLLFQDKLVFQPGVDQKINFQDAAQPSGVAEMETSEEGVI